MISKKLTQLWMEWMFLKHLMCYLAFIISKITDYLTIMAHSVYTQFRTPKKCELGQKSYAFVE